MKFLGGLIVLVALAAGGLYWAATTPVHQLPPVQVSDAAALAAQQKIGAVVAAEARARLTGAAIPVAVTLTDAELNSLVDQRLRDSGETAVRNLVLHSSSSGVLEAEADTDLGGWTFPVYLAGTLRLNAGQVQLQLQTAQVGRLPMPASLEQSFETRAQRYLALGTLLGGISNTRITIQDGRIGLVGIAEP